MKAETAVIGLCFKGLWREKARIRDNLGGPAVVQRPEVKIGKPVRQLELTEGDRELRETFI